MDPEKDLIHATVVDEILYGNKKPQTPSQRTAADGSGTPATGAPSEYTEVFLTKIEYLYYTDTHCKL